MIIGVLSDTHIYKEEQAKTLADRLLSGPFTGVEAILHAGDVIITELENYFYPLPWYSVRGNMDHSLVDVPISRIVTIKEKRIGLIHGWGNQSGMEQRVLTHFPGQDLAAIVFGHTHQPFCQKIGTTLLFNPGSATDRRHASHHTVGLLHIEVGKEIVAEIIPLD